MKLLDKIKQKKVQQQQRSEMKKVMKYDEYFNGHHITYTHLINLKTNKYYILKEYENGYSQIIESNTSTNVSIYVN